MTTNRNTDPTTAPIEVFRSGRHTDTAGRTVAFTDADLAQLAESYDPAVHEAPIVVGHPEVDAPAYGWVQGLRVEGGTLLAQPKQVDPAFAELVRAGRYKRVSVSLYSPDAPNNPKPGSWYLRHVGVLGAQPPAVKGLKPISFASGEEGVVELAETWTLGIVGSALRRMREFMLTQFGQETADRVLPSGDLDLISDAPSLPMPPPTPAYSEPGPTDTPKKDDPMPDQDRAAELAAREKELVRREAAVAELERQRHREQAVQFADELVAASQLPKASRELVVQLLGTLADPKVDLTKPLAFCEVGEVVPADALKALLKGMPRQVAFGEVAGDGIERVDLTDHRSITRGAEALIKAEADKGHALSFADAVVRISREAQQ
jgi:hypothetical protein